MAAKVITAVGNAQIDTAQSKFGGASGLFDGTGDYLTTPDNVDFNFGVGKWTIDFWVRFNSVASVQFLYQQRDAADDFFNIYWGTDKIVVQYISANTWQVDFSVPLAAAINTWYHIEIVRDGTTEATWHVFIDGTDGTKTVTTGTFDTTIKDFTSVVAIGQQDANYYLNGWLDEFRVSKGVARHTANFTPATAAYATDADTVLLLHCDGTDGSTTFTDSSVVASSMGFFQFM